MSAPLLLSGTLSLPAVRRIRVRLSCLIVIMVDIDTRQSATSYTSSQQSIRELKQIGGFDRIQQSATTQTLSLRYGTGIVLGSTR